MNRRNLLAAALGLPLAPVLAVAAPSVVVPGIPQVWGTCILPGTFVWRNFDVRCEVNGNGDASQIRRVWHDGKLVYDSASVTPPGHSQKGSQC